MLALLAAGSGVAQDAAFERVKHATAALQAAPEDMAKLSEEHLALRDWVESRLPDIAPSSSDVEFLQARLHDQLQSAGLVPPETPDGRSGSGYVEIEFRRLPELYDTIFLVSGATVECGTGEAVYLYHWDAQGRKRVIEDRPATPWQNTGATLELSDADGAGRRLLVMHYTSVQCASSWEAMAYSVYRLSPRADSAERLSAEEHGFWMGDDGPEFVLKPGELVIQFLDESINTDIHNRTRIHRYLFNDGVRRLDPVALQPQDFVEEWLTRPWSEMQSRSAPETQAQHEHLHGDLIFADYDAVVPCAARPGRWLIGLDLRHIDKDLDPPLTVWFLVEDQGDFHYRMESVGEQRPQGCPGEGDPSQKHPKLSTDELKALK